LTAALTQGEQINRVLVLEPTSTAWMYQGNEAKLKEVGGAFFNLLRALEMAQVEYDLGCENVLADHGSITGKQLKVGRRAYDVVVIPQSTENLNAKTWELLYLYLQAGGQLLSCAQAVERCDGQSDAAPVRMVAANERWQKVDAAELPALLMRRQLQDAVTIVGRAGEDKGILFHHRRQLRDGELLFLVNTSIKSPSRGTVVSTLQGVEKWDLASGDAAPYRFSRNERNISADFELPPSGSLLLFLSKKPMTPAPALVAANVSSRTKLSGGTSLPPSHDGGYPLASTGTLETRRLEPNVLTLDFVDITAGGESKTNVYFYQAQQFAFKKNGMDRNPWDSAVQFKDELISKKFAPDSGFTANYKFTIESSVPQNLAIVIERPDLYSITCNGQPVTSKPGDWWLDKAFGKIPLATAARVGENIVTIKAAPFTIYHELEPAYVLGDFMLKATDTGFVITPDRALSLGEWNKAGHPFYATGVAYRQRFDVAKPDGQFVVSLPKWYGSVAKVSLNGKPAGYIDAPPWECDVTKQIRRGENTVEVTVIGTLKNTLGPHHGKPALGAAWPNAFQTGPASGPPPGEEYSTVGYGLFEPFELKHVAPAVCSGDK
jgi:hypothetical protein